MNLCLKINEMIRVANNLYHTAQTSFIHEQLERFEVLTKLPNNDDGVLLWCDSIVDGLTLRSIYIKLGYNSELLCDTEHFEYVIFVNISMEELSRMNISAYRQ